MAVIMQWGRRACLVVALAIALVIVQACKPSIEGETRAWDQNKLTLQEWSGKFANFKPAINDRVAEAQRDFDAAKALGDADARAAKMREANDKLYALTTAFQEIDRKVKEYDVLKNDPALLKLSGAMLMPALQAAENMMRTARMRMDGPVSNAGEALGRLRDASAGITNACKPLEDLRMRANSMPSQPPGQMGNVPPGAPPMAGQPGMGMPPNAGAQPALGAPPGALPPGGLGGPVGMRPAMPMAPGVVQPGQAMPGGAPMQGQMPVGGQMGGPMGMRPMGSPGAAPMGGPPPPPGAPPKNAPPAGAKPF